MAVLAAVCLVMLAWAVVSNRLERWNITGPLVFAAAGYLLGNPAWGPVPVDIEAPAIHVLAELTLALLLFSDASRINVAAFRQDIALPGRLLALGLPLTVMLGALAAALLFGDLSWSLALFIGAALAPTDAALSAQVIDDERVPARVRRALNIESGLNDGIVTPVVVFALAVAAGEFSHGTAHSGGADAILALAIGVAVGIVLGFVTARMILFASDRRWVRPGGRRLATLAAAAGSFALAQSLGGNGFIAAFVAGVVFGATQPHDRSDLDRIGELPELLGQVLALGVWFLFGAALVPVAIEYGSWATLVYAVLSLTVIRILPVALSLWGTRIDRATVLFVGWFGPRGLASVVFALLAIEELGKSAAVGQAIAVIVLTVLLSVVVHGVTAGPLGARYTGRPQDAPPNTGAVLRSRPPGT